MNRLTTLLFAALLAIGLASPAQAAPKKDFRIAWSIYVGWMPWGYAADAGIVKKWADKYGISIDVVQINDYVESINQYTAGAFDGCVMTNMDALTIPAAGGVDSTALIVGDFSNGNDGVVLKGATDLKAIKGRKVNLVELSVSHYLLARGLESVGLTERDITVVNTGDADIVAAAAAPEVDAIVTWNPQLAEVKALPGASLVFDSGRDSGRDHRPAGGQHRHAHGQPGAGQGADRRLVRNHGADGRAGRRPARPRARPWPRLPAPTWPASTASSPPRRCSTSRPRRWPSARDPALLRTMDYVRTFSFAHGLLGEGAKSADAVGIAFPGGSTLGDAGNVKLRFDDTYMKMAADGAL